MIPAPETAPGLPSSGTVEEFYETRLAELRAGLVALQRSRRWTHIALAACLAAAAFFLLHAGSLPLAALPVAAAALALRESLRIHARSRELALRGEFYERGLDRLRHNWTALQATGDEFARGRHLYQTDLQIIGPRSLFSLLCTTRTQAGAARLAAYLLDPALPAEILARQQAVRELRSAIGLREEIALLGKYQFQECSPDSLGDWFRSPLLRAHPVVVGVLFLNAAVLLVLLGACVAQVLAWIHVLPALLALALLQFTLSAPLFSGVRERIRLLSPLTGEFAVLQPGLALLAKQNFTAPKLISLVAQVRASAAPRQLRRLQRLFSFLDQRNKEWFAFPSLLIAAGSQLVLAIDRWRGAHQADLESWLDAWAEFEALNAVAGYAFEHPGDVFPELTPISELVSGPALFEAHALAHPLLPPSAVRNDIALSASIPFHIVSGSNMAGKSTWLRAIGMNAVLAYAGAPVRAAALRLSLLAIGASSSIIDSLLDGKSRFLAEAERLRAILDQSLLHRADPARAALFLIDEILSGTNPHDRRVAVEAMVHALVARGAIGVLSTHDLALTEIAAAPGLSGLNFCMESADPADPLHFDYRVKPGVSRISSALAILDRIGIPVEAAPTPGC
ncbi:MAG TPA: hypothetical protein VHX37_14230 [Acidobacteriaceae bacterium]|jgi:hypothetical protein|nr:hypothetical protein [Acidobacteriaceae bacterium]